MTRTAMSNELRTKPAVKTNKQLVNGFKKFGFKVQWVPYPCEACHEEMTAAAQSVGYTGTTPPWGNAKTALKFKKGNKTIIACKCGWRKSFTVKPKAVRKCANEWCNVVLNPNDPNTICFRCRNAKQSTPPKEAVSSDVTM